MVVLNSSRKWVFSLALSALVTVGSGSSVFAAQTITDATENITAVDELTLEGTATGTVTSTPWALGTFTVAENATGTIAMGGNTLNLTGVGSTIRGSASFTASGGGTINVSGNITVYGSSSIAAGTTALVATNLYLNYGEVFNVSGDNTMNFGGVGTAKFGASPPDITLALSGTGEKILNTTTLDNLKVSTASTITASGELTVKNLDVDASITLATGAGNAVTASTGTDVANGVTLTTSGTGTVNLGAVTGDGTVNFGGTGEKTLSGTTLTTLQVSGVSTVNAAGTLTVGTLDIDANTTLATGAGNAFTANTATNVDNNMTLTTSGSGTVNLGAVAGTGSVNFGGTGEGTLSSTTLTNLQISGVCTVNAANTLNVDNLNIDANATLATGAGNAVTASTGTDVANGVTLTTSGTGTVNLGAVSGDGSVNFGGTGEKTLSGTTLTTLQVSGASTITAANTLTVGSLDIDANTTLATGGNAVTATTGTDLAENMTLTNSGSGTVSLGSVTAAANSTLALNDTGTVKLHGGSATNLTVQAKADNAALETTGVLAVKDMTVDAGVTGFTATNGHTLTVANFELGSTAAGTNTSGTITYTGSGTDSVTDTTLTSATVSGSQVDGGTGTLVIDNTSTTGGAVHTVQIDTLTLAGNNAINYADVEVKDTGAGGAVGNTVTNVNITDLNIGDDGVAQRRFGTLKTTDLAGKVTVGTVTLKGTGTGTGCLYLNGDAADKLAITEVKLEGATETDDAMINARGHAAITTLTLAEGKFGEVDFYSSNTTIATANIDGSLVLYAAAAAGSSWTLGSTDVINIGKTGFIETVGGSKITTVDGAKVILDLGNEDDTSVYAKVSGQLVTSDANADGDTVSDIYAKNGVSGTTYNDVFDTAIMAGNGSTFGDDKLLSTEDEYRVYKLADNGKDVVVTSAGGDSSIRVEVTTHGGTATAGKAAQYLVDNQGSFDPAGQKYTAELTSLTGAKAARAAEETIGEEATVQTTQAALTTVVGAANSVGNQMTSFRSGGLSAGMSSSFGSGGATAALESMADAETLEDAYGSVSGQGYTAAAEGTYKKVEAWANGFGGLGEQGSTGDMTGYSFWNAGTMVGLDYAVAREFRVGALVGYSYNKTTVNWHSGNSTDNALRFGAYSSFNWDNFYFDFSPTMGVHLIDSARYLWNGATAKSERVGLDFNANGTLGYNFILPYEVNITPSYALSYTLFNDPEYTETGAGAGNVKYKSFTSNSLVQSVGVKVGKLFSVSDSLAFLPEVWGGWEYEYLDTGGDRNTTTSASLGAQTYSTEMNAMEQSRGYWGMGVTALLNDNVSVYGRYDQRMWYKGFNVSFLAGVKIGF